MLLCLIFALSFVLGSCDTAEDESDESKAPGIIGNDHGGYDEAEELYFVNLPEFDMEEKKEFRVLVLDNTTETTYYSEEVGFDKYDTTDDVLNDAVRNRNNKVLEDHGIEIVPVYTANVYNDVDLDVSAGSGDFDAAMPFLSQCRNLAQSGHLYDLAEERFSPYIDFSMPWWDQNATESLSIDHKVFFTTGDISIMQKIVSIAMTFNKEMLEENFPGTNLYDMVKEGKWTFDKLVEMSKQVTSDSNGDSKFTYEDTWGLSASYGDAPMFYLGTGESFVTKDADDLPMITIGTERSILTAKKILEQLQVKDEWCIHAQNFGTDNMWQTSLDIFGENRALFRTSAFSAIKKLRQYKDGAEFGVVPVPKYDEAQDRYYTPCQARMAYGIVIQKSAKDPEFSAYMIEAMACEAKNNITDAYYETILKSRDMKDEDSEEMLDDYIFNNVVYDLGFVYDFGTVSTMLDNLMATGSSDIASEFESRKEVIQAAIDEVVNNYQ